jgi:hypothetical protein
MATAVDKNLFDLLFQCDPEDVCRRTRCSYDHRSKSYRVSIWGDDYQICPHDMKIEPLASPKDRPHDYLYVFMVNYLLNAKDLETSRQWISEKDLPGGATFFRGPHAIPTHRITDRFGVNLGAFRKHCEQLGGEVLETADAAYVFQITPRLPVAVLYWVGDAEFPSEAKLLYDQSIVKYLAADIVFALAVAVCTRLARDTKRV